MWCSLHSEHNQIVLNYVNHAVITFIWIDHRLVKGETLKEIIINLFVFCLARMKLISNWIFDSKFMDEVWSATIKLLIWWKLWLIAWVLSIHGARSHWHRMLQSSKLRPINRFYLKWLICTAPHLFLVYFMTNWIHLAMIKDYHIVTMNVRLFVLF